MTISKYLFLFILIFFLSSCDDSTARLGTAQHTSVEAEAHAAATRDAAEAATIDAAAKAAKAAELEAIAIKTPTAERIAAAADARVSAASAKAVAEALAKVAADSENRAKSATKEAEQERIKEQKAESEARWLLWCRAIALGCVLVGAVLGGLIGYATKNLRLAAIVGGGIAALGAIVLAFGVALPWLPWLVPAGVLIALVAWAVSHRRLQITTAEIDKGRAVLATGYLRTADALGQLAPKLRQELDRLSIAEQHAAGVLSSNDHALDRATVHPNTVPAIPAPVNYSIPTPSPAIVDLSAKSPCG